MTSWTQQTLQVMINAADALEPVAVRGAVRIVQGPLDIMLQESLDALGIWFRARLLIY